MAKKKYQHKLTYKNMTAGLIKETSNGFLFSMPLIKERIHFQIIIEEHRISGHTTIEDPNGKIYPKDGRFEIDISQADFSKIEEINFENYLTKSGVKSLPGRTYLGGYFQQFLQLNKSDLQKSSLEDHIERAYLVKRNELSGCPDKIWIAYDKAGGIKGKWYNIGLVFGTLENNECYFLSWKQLGSLCLEMLNKSNVKVSITLDDSPKGNVLPCLVNYKNKEYLTKKGKTLSSKPSNKMGWN